MKLKLPKIPWFKTEVHQEGLYFHKILALRITKIILWTLLVIILAPTLLFFYYRPRIQHDINYGVTFSRRYAESMGLDWEETYLAILDDLKVKNIRLVAYWDAIETEDNKYDYTFIEKQLDEADKRNLNVILAFGRKVPRYPECFEPWWWKQIPDVDLQNQKLYEYIEETVRTLGKHPSIKIWQVENEPHWPFGLCPPELDHMVVDTEVKIVRGIDGRPVMSQDSGEGGLWYKTYSHGDLLGISMYRKIWYNFWGIFLGNYVYFQYPLANWTYAVKAGIVRVPIEKIIVTELQAEPWGPGLNSILSEEEKNKTMSRNDFYATLDYAQRAGFKDIYLWGAEWWYWEKTKNNNPFFWDTAKALFYNPGE